MAIVDIHCHTFNGDDLPVKGFIKRVGGTKTSLVHLIDDLVDDKVQGHAPGLAKELEEVQKRLDPELEGLEVMETEQSLDEEAEAVFAEISAANVELVQAAQDELSAESTAPTEEGLEGILDTFGDVKRWVKWALLFAKSRVKLTEILADTYGEVNLFTPMLVDLEPGLNDPAETSVHEQLQMQAEISKVSMLGKLRGSPDARVHPFVGFDPRRAGAVEIVRDAVTDFGCVGVKMYPPMGFRPLGNLDHPLPEGMSAAEAEAVDATLRELYAFCVADEVPVTAHGNPTNFAAKAFDEFSSPDNWRSVLDEFPDLHLNLGHFGGSGEGDHADWPAKIAALAGSFPHLYADIGNHDLDGLADYMSMLRGLFTAPATATMQSRLMFGTDWYMVANHRDFKEFLVEFRSEYGKAFPENQFPGARDDFMGGNALRFLGFDDSHSKNTQRVVKRYRDLNAAIPGWLTIA